MSERVGVFLCRCGPNIGEAVHVDELNGFAGNLEHVVLSKTVDILCSEEGREIIGRDIKEHALTRVVIAACSPKEHEITFRKSLEKAGLNPFLLQMANIREQCAWVVKDRPLATEKARSMVNAAVRRVVHHQPLETNDLECRTEALVIGAGIAGISAALTLAQKDRKVYLLEKLPCIGGKAARYESVFPGLECASCMMDPILDEVLHHEMIEVLTCSTVQEVLGYYGNFLVRIKQRARHADAATCIGCGACLDVCPVTVPNEYNEGLDERRAIYIPYAGAMPNVPVIDREHCLRWRGEDCRACRESCPFGCIRDEEDDQLREIGVGAIILATGFETFDPGKAPQYGYEKTGNIYTGLEFERMLSSNGPTGGNIQLRNGTPPRKIALVHCVGSRSSQFNEHCSSICCLYSLKFALQAREKLPEVSITGLYSDFCLPGKHSQSFFNRVSTESGMEFLRMDKPDSVLIADKDGEIVVEYRDVRGNSTTVTADMAVLAASMEGATDAGDLAGIFDISTDDSRFFVERDSKTDPLVTSRDGVYVAGCARGPASFEDSVTQGRAAAGIILSRLVRGEKISPEAAVASVEESLCSGCKTCVALCPYKAITYNESEKQAVINSILCRGCGICPAACPGGAIEAYHFTDTQIYAETRGLLEELPESLPE